MRKSHPDTRVNIHWESNGLKFNVITTIENFKDCLVEVLESTLIDNVETVFYTLNGETKELDYYNVEL